MNLDRSDIQAAELVYQISFIAPTCKDVDFIAGLEQHKLISDSFLNQPNPICDNEAVGQHEADV